MVRSLVGALIIILSAATISTRPASRDLWPAWGVRRTLTGCHAGKGTGSQGVALGYPAWHLRCEKGSPDHNRRSSCRIALTGSHCAH
jgi:hypothetical protein